jgi:hypothetical protein
VSTPRDLLDRMIRDTLHDPQHLRAFLRQVVPHLAENFDYTQVKAVEREFPRSDWHGREADLPFTIPYRWGDEQLLAIVCLLIEHQSDTDPLMPLRLLFFLVGYWERQWQEWEQSARPRAALRLHPVLPIVLYTAPVSWGSNRTVIDLLGEPEAFHVFAPRWEPLFWNLADRTPEQLLESQEDWLHALAVIRAQDEEGPRFQDIYGQAYVRIRSLGEQNLVRWDQLARMIYHWGHHCRPESEREALRTIAEASQTNPARRREIQQMGQTIAEALRTEGLNQGRAEGLNQGRTEGRTEGQIIGARTILRTLLEEKFGTLPDELLHRMETATDLSRLQHATRQAVRLEKLEDLQL